MAQTGAYRAALVAAAGDGGVLNLLNPEGVDLIVTKVVVNVRTPSTGACTVDLGVTTASAASDNLIDGQSIAAAGAFADLGTNGKRAIKWPLAGYLTGTVASGTVTGLVGEVYVEYLRPSTS